MTESQRMGEAPAHILVVDDDDRIRTLLKRFLTDNGFIASLAANGEEARRLLSSVEFDLLIVDVMMPGISGFELTEKVRAGSNVPILLLTAIALRPAVARSAACGARPDRGHEARRRHYRCGPLRSLGWHPPRPVRQTGLHL